MVTNSILVGQLTFPAAVIVSRRHFILAGGALFSWNFHAEKHALYGSFYLLPGKMLIRQFYLGKFCFMQI
jgi:hypothetical protein